MSLPDEDEPTIAPLATVLRGGPWYFILDELIHRGPDRLGLLRLPGYWRVRSRYCNYVDRRLGAFDETEEAA